MADLPHPKVYGDFVLRLRFQCERGARGKRGVQIHQHDEVKLRFKDVWIKEF